MLRTLFLFALPLLFLGCMEGQKTAPERRTAPAERSATNPRPAGVDVRRRRDEERLNDHRPLAVPTVADKLIGVLPA